jgi:hypothetical protein
MHMRSPAFLREAFRDCCCDLIVVLIGALALACSDASSEPQGPDASLLPKIVPGHAPGGDAGSCDPINTPAGQVPKSCVHQVPDGARVSYNDAGTTIVSKDGKVIALYPPCGCASADAGKSLDK